MTNRNCLKTAVTLIAVLAFIACGGVGKANAGDFSYDLTKDGKGIIITKYTGKPGKVAIPAKIENLPVVEIGADAFNGASYSYSGTGMSDLKVNAKANEKAGITSITIPKTVKKIGSSAFANTAITNFNMPDSVTTIENSIFSGCKQLAEIRLSDNLEYLPELGSVVGNLSVLKKINLPKNLKAIAQYAFSSCGELSDLVIPDTIKSIDWVIDIGPSNYNRSPDRPDFKTDTGKPKYPTGTVEYFGRDYVVGWHPVKDARGSYNMFDGCGKLPITTRQKLKSFGYEGTF